MAYTRGRCSNVDYCTLAVARRDIEVKVGEDFICPECARPLKPPPAGKASGGGLNLALVGGGVALLLIGGGIFAGSRLFGGAAPAAVAMSSRPAPAAAQAASSAAGPPAVQARMAALSVPAATPAAFRPEQTVLLRLAGSREAGDAAMQRLAAAYLSSLGDTSVVVQPGKAGQTLVTGQRLSHPEAIAIVTSPDGGDADAPAAIARGAADAGLAARRATPAEMEAMHGVEEHQVGFAAEAVVVAPRNPVSQISLAQLRGVVAGSITSWSALGGPARPIHLLRKTGAARLDDLLPGTTEAVATEHRLANPAAAVMEDADALAIVPLAESGAARQVAIAAIGAPPALPTAANIADESYPLARPVYVYATPPQAGDVYARPPQAADVYASPPQAGQGRAANPFAQRLAQFAASPDGQAVLTQAGLVPLHVAAAIPAAPPTPKERYKALVLGSKRLAADLHFEPNSNKLDLHSAREVDRVWNFMMSDHTPSDHIVLIGFADNQGTPDANLAISRQRAQAVADVFAHRGLPPGQIVPFGAELPVADNGTENGREKNRRVEVFLRP